MATAARAPLSLIAETPEEQGYLEELRASRKALQDALLNRQQLFDPTLLAMAQGFLAPTKSGGFGESLGNVAAQLGPVLEREQKQNMEMAQIRAELAAQQMAEAQATRGEKEFRSVINRLAPSGAPGAPGAQGVSGAPGQGQGPGADQQFRPLTELDVARIASMPGMEGRAKILGDMLKSQRDRFVISMQGIVFDRDTQQYLNLPIPGQKQEDFSTPYGTYKMTPYEYDQYRRAEEEGKGQQWIESFRRPGGMAKPAPGAPGAPAAAPAAPGAATAAPGRLTTSEAEARAAALKAEAEVGGKSRAAQTTAVRDAGKSALSLMPIYDRAEILAKAPGMDQVLGVLEKSDIISQLGSLAEEAIRVGTFNVGIPAVRKVLANAGTPQDLIDKAAELGQVIAMIQFNQRQGLGSGTSVSNFEQRMVNAMGPDIQDTVRSFTQKLAFMKEKARFESELAKALRKSKMQYEDFEDTPEFQKLFDEYRRRATGIAYPGQRPFTVQR